MIIAVDFDGTLCRGMYPNIDGPQPYAIDIMKRLAADGHYLIIWTCRGGERLQDAIWKIQRALTPYAKAKLTPENILILPP